MHESTRKGQAWGHSEILRPAQRRGRHSRVDMTGSGILNARTSRPRHRASWSARTSCARTLACRHHFPSFPGYPGEEPKPSAAYRSLRNHAFLGNKAATKCFLRLLCRPEKGMYSPARAYARRWNLRPSASSGLSTYSCSRPVRDTVPWSRVSTMVMVGIKNTQHYRVSSLHACFRHVTFHQGSMEGTAERGNLPLARVPPPPPPHRLMLASPLPAAPTP